MQKYSQEFKQSIVDKALAHPELTLRELAKNTHVSRSSIHQWITHFKAGRLTSPASKEQGSWTYQDKVTMVLETANLDEVAIGTYCRKHGIFSHQLTTWREEIMAKPLNDKTVHYRKEIRTLKAQKQQLEKELRRKDKALAEASALLILKKKAMHLWGENADD